MYTDTDWAEDELTREFVSFTVERLGNHMLDCSVAKQSSVALFSGEAEFYGIVRAMTTSKQTSHISEQIGMKAEVTIASDSSAARGICTRGDQERSDNFQYQKVMGAGGMSQGVVPAGVDTLLNWADIGTKEHMSERLTSLLRQMPVRLRE